MKAFLWNLCCQLILKLLARINNRGEVAEQLIINAVSH
jgi:hypothetical protein